MTTTPTQKKKSVAALIGGQMSISHHVLKSLKLSKEDTQTYLELLAFPLAKQTEMTDKQYSYFTSLEKLLDCKDIVPRIEYLMVNTGDIPLDKAIDFMNINNTLQAAWIVDAVFLAHANGAMSDIAKEVIPAIADTFQIKKSAAKTLIRHAKSLAISEEAEALIDAVAYLNHRYQCSAWQTILDYRRFNMADAINGLMAKLAGNFEAAYIQAEIAKVRMGSLMNCMDFGETSLLMRGALKVQKKFVLSDFNNLMKKAEIFGESFEATICEANQVLSAFGYDTEHNPYTPLVVLPDTDTSASNTEWYDNMEKAFDGIEQYLNGWNDTAHAIAGKLKKIAKGKWPELLREVQEA